MEAFGPTAPCLHAPGELVDDDDFPILYDILLIIIEKRLRTHRGLKVMRILHASFGVEVLEAERLLCLRNAGLSDLHRALLLVDGVVLLYVEVADDGREALVEPLSVPRRSRDDERRSCLVDKNGVHLVDDGVVMPALIDLRRVVRSIVAEIIEAKFVVGGVRNISRIRFLLRRRTEVVVEDLK